LYVEPGLDANLVSSAMTTPGTPSTHAFPKTNRINPRLQHNHDVVAPDADFPRKHIISIVRCEIIDTDGNDKQAKRLEE
jgi:hypothetical protein